MPDEPKDPKPEEKPKEPATGDLGDAGKKALAEERAARKAAEKSAADLEARLKAIEDKDKTETQKAADAAATEKAARVAAEARADRLEVAMAKGLTPAQAKRLQGATRDELEADADDLLETLKPAEGTKPPPGGKPTERLTGGGDPTEDPVELDPRKLAAGVRRGY